MVVLGYDSTIPVTVEDMIHHTKAVKRGAKDTFIVVDMPFMSYHLSIRDTLITSARDSSRELEPMRLNSKVLMEYLRQYKGITRCGYSSMCPSWA